MKTAHTAFNGKDTHSGRYDDCRECTKERTSYKEVLKKPNTGFIAGLGSFVIGLISTATIIGAIVGIPLMVFGIIAMVVSSWSMALGILKWLYYKLVRK